MTKRFIFNEENPNINQVKRGLMTELKAMDLSKPKQVEIKDYKKDKTAEQRSWFHTLCGLLGEELGYTKGEMKECIKQEEIGTKEIVIGGATRQITASSERLSREDYSKLIETTYRIAAEVGVVLPNPTRGEDYGDV